jgi:transaldolase
LFVSRVDSKADQVLPADSEFRGRIAIANARCAYHRYRTRFADRRWSALRDAGARPQRPLWASTGTKDAAYSDVLYVQELIAPDVINTMPESTLHAFADHGDATRDFTDRITASAETLRQVEHAGLELAAITSALEREGVRSFCASYHELLGCIEAKLHQTAPALSGRS